MTELVRKIRLQVLFLQEPWPADLDSNGVTSGRYHGS